MQHNKSRLFRRPETFVLALCVVVSIVLGFWTGWLQAFRMVFGAVVMLLVPGYAWSFVFWPMPTLSVPSRLGFAFFFSLVVPPLITFGLTRFGAALTPGLAIAVALVVAAIGGVAPAVRLRITKRRVGGTSAPTVP